MPQDREMAAVRAVAPVVQAVREVRAEGVVDVVEDSGLWEWGGAPATATRLRSALRR